MTQKLYEAIMELITHSASQLIPYENFLREASKLLDSYWYTKDEDRRELDSTLEEIGIAKAENAAFMIGVAEGDEPRLMTDYDMEMSLDEILIVNDIMHEDIEDLPF